MGDFGVDTSLAPKVISGRERLVSRNGHRPRWFDLDFCMQSHVERIEYLDRSLERDAKILVSLIARDLRLMHIEPLR